jgi:hypothetical protein
LAGAADDRLLGERLAKERPQVALAECRDLLIDPHRRMIMTENDSSAQRLSR